MSFLRTSLLWFICICLLLLTVNAASPQLQMFISSGRIFLPDGLIRLLLLFLLVPLFFVTSNGIRISQMRGLIMGLLLAALVGVSIIYIAVLNGSLNIGLNMFNVFFLSPLILLIIALLGVQVNGLIIKRILLMVATVVIFLGLWQAIVNPFMLPVHSTDGKFKVASYNFYGDIRSFSLFTSPYEYGIFLIFIAVLCLYSILNKKYFYIFGLSITLIAIYFTYTRNIYISTFLAMFLTLIYYYISQLRSNHKSLFRTLIYLGVFISSFAVPYGLQRISEMVGDENIYQPGNLDIRLRSWSYWIDRMAREGPWDLIFGSGYFQDVERNRSYVFVGEVLDNQLLSLMVGMGALSVVCWLGLTTLIWWRVNRAGGDSRAERNELLLTGLTMFSIWPLMGQFNILSSSLFTLTALALLGRATPPQASRGGNSRVRNLRRPLDW